MRCDIELVIHANFVKVNNDDNTHIHITKEKVGIFPSVVLPTFRINCKLF